MSDIQLAVAISELRQKEEEISRLRAALKIATDIFEEHAEIEESRARRIQEQKGGELIGSHAREVLGDIKKALEAK